MNGVSVDTLQRIFKFSAKRRARMFVPVAVAAFLGVSIAVLQRPSARRLGIAVLLLGFVGCVAGLVWWAQAKMYPGRSVELYGPSGVLKFRGFRFKTKFWPERVQESVCVRPDEILGVSIVRNRGEEFGISLRTVAGVVTVSSAIEGYNQLKYVVESYVEKTQADVRRYTELVRQAPTLRTPWYGWILLVIALLACALSIYYFGLS